MAENDFTHTGQKFGMLTVLSVDRREQKSGFFVLCRCECGSEKIVRFNYLQNGHTRSCGCIVAVKNKARSTHGHARKGAWTETYSIFRDMMTRCTNPRYKEFHLYGGRGISICDRWLRNYENFLSDMGERPAGMTLERIDVNLGYSPDNCKWATDTEQANNKRNSVFLDFQGKRQTVAQWSRELGLHDKTIYMRLSKGASTEQALRPAR